MNRCLTLFGHTMGNRASRRPLLLRFKWLRTAMLAMLALCLAGVLLMTGMVHALDPNQRITQYLHTPLRIDGSAPSGMYDGEGRSDSIGRDPRNLQAQAGHAGVRDVRFAHLTTNEGLSQGYVTAILQDRRGFMWFATRDGLSRYDGNAFVVYKNNPSDPGSLSSNFLQDLLQDEDGYLWIATDTGVDKFDPTTERCIRYLHDANNPNSIGGAWVTSIARGHGSNFWFGTFASGIDRL